MQSTTNFGCHLPDTTRHEEEKKLRREGVFFPSSIVFLPLHLTESVDGAARRGEREGDGLSGKVKTEKNAMKKRKRKMPHTRSDTQSDGQTNTQTG